MQEISNILRYLPQRSPFVLIDELVSASPKNTVTRFTVPCSHVLLRNELLTAGGIVENMAQTAAAGEARKAELAGISLSGGYLVSVSKLKINAHPAIGATITTEASYVQSILKCRVISARVWIEDHEIASAELKIIVNE